MPPVTIAVDANTVVAIVTGDSFSQAGRTALFEP
jgi:hypothetical protein